MDAIEKRARELLARLQKAKRNEAGHWCDARAAVDATCDTLPQIIAALTPPEGFVLVPVEPTEAMLAAGGDAEQIHVEWGVDPYVANSVEIWAAMLSARPEVKP